jgi:hypothetical protein
MVKAGTLSTTAHFLGGQSALVLAVTLGAYA